MRESISAMKSNHNPDRSLQISKLLADYIRWMVVLAQLKELAGKEHRYPVKQLVQDLQLLTLFPSLQGEISREPIVSLSKKAWEIWFCGKSVDKGESPLNSVYQCRSFYALDAPNNLLSRLNKLLEIAIDSNKTLEIEPRRGKKESKYDRYLEQWGEYAIQLVWANGGWENFSNKQSLSEVVDVWMGLKPPRELMTGNDRDSLIQRILYLDSDRYVQILTASMGILYPLWFFKSYYRKEILDRIATQDRGLKKALPKRDLYIDVNTHIGTMAGLPYPFGVADEMLSYCWDVQLDRIENYLAETAWCPIAMQAIARELQNDYWSPPLLFTLWADEFPPPDDDKHNYPIPLIALTQGGNKFGEIYQRQTTIDRPLNKLALGLEPYTYADKILERLSSQAESSVSNHKYTRTEILTQHVTADLIATYFPLSLLLQVNPYYQQLTTADLYHKWGNSGDAFNYNSPQLVLAGGMFLTRQAKMTDLIIDLSTYLHIVELLIRSLRPEWESIDRYLKQIESNNVSDKQAAANFIHDACQVIARKHKLVKDGSVGVKVIPELFTAIVIEMVTALIPQDTEKQQECIGQIYDWGWVKLLESSQSTAIYIACELFVG
jgi:hypothetical protein